MSAVLDSTFHTENDLDQIMLLLINEDRILVSRDHFFQPYVRSAIERIKSQYPDRTFDLKPVGMEQIARKKSEGAGDSTDSVRTESEMQKAATDLFKKAVLNKASDIHIRVSSKSRTQILFRIHNDLQVVEEHPATWGRALCTTIYHAMTDVADSTFDELSRQDARIADRAKLTDGLDGIRIATTPKVDGYVMVLRLLYDAAGASDDICDLGFSNTQRARVQILKKRPTGIILISGPTGSGKSTTLQRTLTSLIRETNGRKHIITVEDPPEYPIIGAVQTPVTNADTEEARSAAFQLAIKGAMRLDPDVIMIGEIRDTPSARLAFQAAMTGHQVWSTLHSNGAFHSIDRLVDLGISLNLMTDPSILSGLICQRLLKVLCKCKKPLLSVMDNYRETRETFAEDMNRISSVVNLEDVYVSGDGCEECRSTGTTGRTVVAEVVVTDQKMMSLIRVNDLQGAIEYWKAEQGGMSMVDHAILKVKQGIVDPFATEDSVGPLDGGKSIFSFHASKEGAVNGN